MIGTRFCAYNCSTAVDWEELIYSSAGAGAAMIGRSNWM